MTHQPLSEHTSQRPPNYMDNGCYYLMYTFVYGNSLPEWVTRTKTVYQYVVDTYLQDAVKGVEGQPSKGGQGVLLVVLVMDVMQHPAAQPGLSSPFHSFQFCSCTTHAWSAGLGQG